MNDYTTPRRRPAVPGPGYPSQGGIAARAVALREEKERSEVRLPEAAYNAKSTVAEHAPQGPSIREALPDYAQAVLKERQRTPLIPFQGIGKIAGAIASVMSEIGTIPKTGHNKFHDYHYATLPDLLFVLTPLMGKHGIAVFQSEVEIKTIENRMAVTYDFTVAHSSGETWPEKLRFTGMSIGRDSKGSWDDKAVNKCHSAARKYFLLALFQVPTGDFEDGDEGPAKAQEKRTVPGPDVRPQKPAYQPPPPLTVEERDAPRKLTLGPGAGADAWAKAFIDGIKTAMNGEQLAQWDELNAVVLNKLSNEYVELYQMIDKAVTQKTLQVAPLLAMPDPKNDIQNTMNWVAQMLADCAAYPEAERIWNEAVAPHEGRFESEDWEILMNEWRRNEIRLNPEPEEPEPPEAA